MQKDVLASGSANVTKNHACSRHGRACKASRSANIHSNACKLSVQPDPRRARSTNFTHPRLRYSQDYKICEILPLDKLNSNVMMKDAKRYPVIT